MSENTEDPAKPAPVPEEKKEPNLDQLRDDKCIPLAKAILADIATDLPVFGVLGRKDYQPIVMKILQRTMDADTNLIMENPYIFQLILQALGGLKSTIMQSKPIELDDARYNAIAKRILDIFAGMEHKFGPQTPEETQTAFAPVKDQLNALFAEEKLNGLEIDYIMSNVFGSIKTMQAIFSENVNDAVQRMEAKILGVEQMTDLSMKRLDTALTTPTEEPKA